MQVRDRISAREAERRSLRTKIDAAIAGISTLIPAELWCGNLTKLLEQADAYLERLTQYAANLDGETERLKHDAGIGVVAFVGLIVPHAASVSKSIGMSSTASTRSLSRRAPYAGDRPRGRIPRSP